MLASALTALLNKWAMRGLKGLMRARTPWTPPSASGGVCQRPAILEELRGEGVPGLSQRGTARPDKRDVATARAGGAERVRIHRRVVAGHLRQILHVHGNGESRIGNVGAGNVGVFVKGF